MKTLIAVVLVAVSGCTTLAAQALHEAQRAAMDAQRAAGERHREEVAAKRDARHEKERAERAAEEAAWRERKRLDNEKYAAQLAAQEQERAEREKAAAEVNAKLDNARANPAFRRLVFSTGTCLVRMEEEQALKAIREEKENAKIAGVLNPLLLLKYQNQVVAARKFAEAYAAELKTLKVTPLGCRDKVVAAFVECATGGACPERDDPNGALLLALRIEMAPMVSERE